MAYEDYENEEETEDEEENEESSESSENANAGNNTQAPVNTPAPTNNQPIDTAIKAGQEAQQPTAPAQQPATPAQTSTLPNESPFGNGGQSSDSTSNNTNDVVAKMKGAGLDDETISALQQINQYAQNLSPEEFQKGLANITAQNKNIANLYSQYYGQGSSTSGQQTPATPGTQALTSSYYNSINIDPNKTYGQVNSGRGYVYSYDAKQLQNDVNRAIFDYNKKIANGTIEGKTAADYIQPLKVDGMYGSKTKAAIDALQQAGYNVTNLPASVGNDYSNGNAGTSQSGSSTSSDGNGYDKPIGPTAPAQHTPSAPADDSAYWAANRDATYRDRQLAAIDAKGRSMDTYYGNLLEAMRNQESYQNREDNNGTEWNQPGTGFGTGNFAGVNVRTSDGGDKASSTSKNTTYDNATAAGNDVGEQYSFNWFVNEYKDENPNASDEEARSWAGQQIIGIQNGDIPRPKASNNEDFSGYTEPFVDAAARQYQLDAIDARGRSMDTYYRDMLDSMQAEQTTPDDIQSSGSRGLGGRPMGTQRPETPYSFEEDNQEPTARFGDTKLGTGIKDVVELFTSGTPIMYGDQPLFGSSKEPNPIVQHSADSAYADANRPEAHDVEPLVDRDDLIAAYNQNRALSGQSERYDDRYYREQNQGGNDMSANSTWDRWYQEDLNSGLTPDEIIERARAEGSYEGNEYARYIEGLQMMEKFGIGTSSNSSTEAAPYTNPNAGVPMSQAGSMSQALASVNQKPEPPEYMYGDRQLVSSQNEPTANANERYDWRYANETGSNDMSPDAAFSRWYQQDSQNGLSVDQMIEAARAEGSYEGRQYANWLMSNGGSLQAETAPQEYATYEEPIGPMMPTTAQNTPPVISPERENQYKTLFNNEISALHQMYPDASYSQLYDYLNLFYQQNGNTDTEYYRWFNSFL